MAKAVPVVSNDAGGQHLHHSISSLHSDASTSTACSCGCASEASRGSSTSLEETGAPATPEAASSSTNNALLHQSSSCCGGEPDNNCSRCRDRNGANRNTSNVSNSGSQGNGDRRPANHRISSGESPPSRSRRTTIRLGPRSGPFIALYMPRTGLRGRSHGVTKAFLRALSLTFCELLPWMMGLVVIYYAFKAWGLGPGFSAFLLMMGIHACLRWRKAQSNREPFCLVSRLRRRSRQHQEQVRQEAGERQGAAQTQNEEERLGDWGEDSVEPPPYDMVMTKPPPYDLLFSSQTQSYLASSPKGEHAVGAPSTVINASSLLPVAETLPDNGMREDDAFLPSYNDAVVIAARQDR